VLTGQALGDAKDGKAGLEAQAAEDAEGG